MQRQPPPTTNRSASTSPFNGAKLSMGAAVAAMYERAMSRPALNPDANGLRP
jgi:hypothetical protein